MSGSPPQEEAPLLVSPSSSAHSIKAEEQHFGTRSDGTAAVVVETSAKGAPRVKPVSALLERDSSDVEAEVGMVFVRRVFALLVLQYSTVLLIASPFALLDSFQHVVRPHHHVLEAVAICGIVSSLLLAVTRGAIYPFATVALVSLTLSVALELGLTFCQAWWGLYGLIAVGQATTSFCILLAIVQFPTRSLKWLSYPSAVSVCLVLATLWMVVLNESGLTWTVASAVALGGWSFFLLNLLCLPHICHYVGPEEYILASLFILCPEALACLASNKRHPKDDCTSNSVEAV